MIPASFSRNSFRFVLVAGAILLAYANSFQGSFVFDDIPCITENQSLRHLFDSAIPLSGPGRTVDGRPLLNFSLAVNYAISGEQPWSYHATNLLIHVLASFVLLGILDRTMPLLQGSVTSSRDARFLSLATTLLWAVHPLQTESVTYVIQRAESLCGLFYLLTLYAFIRHHGAAGRARTGWFIVALGACLAGGATKEIIATAPLLLLAYDRLFLSSSWRDTWKTNGRLHLAMAATWLPLIALVHHTQQRGGTAGFTSGLASWHYFVTQLGAIVHYLRLACWPQPLVFDYGWQLQPAFMAVWPQAGLIGFLGVATIAAFVRGHPAAFCGLWFFLILAPTSSFLPVTTQTMAEHRLYLPLAGLIVLGVMAVHRWWGQAVTAVMAGGLVITCIFLTSVRNRAYQSPIILWSDTVQKIPHNPRAQLNYGVSLFVSGRSAEAFECFAEAVRLDPTYSDAHNNLGNALKAGGQRDAALAEYTEAVRLDPKNAVALCNLGATLAAADRWDEASVHYAAAMQVGASADARVEWAAVLGRLGRTGEAEHALREALQENPRLAAAHLQLGNLLARTNRPEDALVAFRQAIQLNPASVEAHNSLGYLLLLLKRPNDAAPEFERALQLAPNSAAIHANYGVALARSGQLPSARKELVLALKIDPANLLAKTVLSELPETPPDSSPPPPPK